MNKKLTDYVIDLVEILNKQQKQVFWGIFDILVWWFPSSYLISCFMAL